LPAVMASADNPITDAKVELGRSLYFETKLSAGNDISCNSCHRLDSYGVDGEKTSEGHKKQRGKRNSPSVFNAAGHFVQFWDGRAKTVEEQAKGPITNPAEMAMPNEKAVIAVLTKDKKYQEGFKKAFPEDKSPITMDNLAKAIGAFERKLVTPSRWDKFLAGDRNALTNAEKKGFKAYLEVGCNTCHAGPYLGGQIYKKLGVTSPWPNQDDLGRFEITKDENDKMVFKVPSLRNIAKTGPYFHDGSVTSLTEATKLMAKHQLGKTISDADASSIVTFLGALTGEPAADLIAPPPGVKAAPAKSGTL